MSKRLWFIVLSALLMVFALLLSGCSGQTVLPKIGTPLFNTAEEASAWLNSTPSSYVFPYDVGQMVPEPTNYANVWKVNMLAKDRGSGQKVYFYYLEPVEQSTGLVAGGKTDGSQTGSSSPRISLDMNKYPWGWVIFMLLAVTMGVAMAPLAVYYQQEHVFIMNLNGLLVGNQPVLRLTVAVRYVISSSQDIGMFWVSPKVLISRWGSQLTGYLQNLASGWEFQNLQSELTTVFSDLGKLKRQLPLSGAELTSITVQVIEYSEAQTETFTRNIEAAKEAHAINTLANLTKLPEPLSALYLILQSFAEAVKQRGGSHEFSGQADETVPESEV